MYHTRMSMKLLTRCMAYMELVRQANNRHDNYRANLAVYDANTDWPKNPIRLMHKRSDFTEGMKRYENLASWLIRRYLGVLAELNQETFKRTSNPLTANELNILHL